MPKLIFWCEVFRVAKKLVKRLFSFTCFRNCAFLRLGTMSFHQRWLDVFGWWRWWKWAHEKATRGTWRRVCIVGYWASWWMFGWCETIEGGLISQWWCSTTIISIEAPMAAVWPMLRRLCADFLLLKFICCILLSITLTHCITGLPPSVVLVSLQDNLKDTLPLLCAAPCLQHVVYWSQRHVSNVCHHSTLFAKTASGTNLQSLLWKKFTLALKDVYLIHSFMAFMALPNTYRLEKVSGSQNPKRYMQLKM